MDITQLLTFGVEQNASDCHLSYGLTVISRNWIYQRFRKKKCTVWFMTS